jgi:type IV secretion system protein VirD4
VSCYVLTLVLVTVAAAGWRWWPHQRALIGTPWPRYGQRPPRLARPWRRHHLDPAVHGLSWHRTFLGFHATRLRRRVCQARWRICTIIFAPPRTGKTRALLIPNVMAWSGCAIVTSTRRDVLDACAAVRSHRGKVWLADVRGVIGPLDDGSGRFDAVRRLDWSPLRGCREWDVAIVRAEALCIDAGRGSTNADHWRGRAIQILASLLHAAALDGKRTSQVVRLIAEKDLDEADTILSRHHALRALQVQKSVEGSAPNELASIWSALGGAMRPFDKEVILECADRGDDCDFDADQFLRGPNTLFIVASSDAGFSVAPLVVGLVEEIRAAALRISDREGELPVPLHLLLDEVANICPLPQLEAILTEGGGRNIVTTLVLQDMGAAERRWGTGFRNTLLQLCGAKVVLPGGADPETLRALSLLAGDRQVRERGRNLDRRWYLVSKVWPRWPAVRITPNDRTTTVPRFSVDDLRSLDHGTAFALVEAQPARLLWVRDYDRVQPFRRWAQLTAPGVAPIGARGPRGSRVPARAWWSARPDALAAKPVPVAAAVESELETA